MTWRPRTMYALCAMRDIWSCSTGFFYAMKDWRSTFGGVNDHEGDWEQVTLFLTESDAAEEPELAWVAFSCPVSRH